MKHKRLYRSRKNRVIAGICGGLAEYFDLSPNGLRVAFVIISLLPGPSIIFYILAWLIIPKEPEPTTSAGVVK